MGPTRPLPPTIVLNANLEEVALPTCKSCHRFACGPLDGPASCSSTPKATKSQGWFQEFLQGRSCRQRNGGGVKATSLLVK
mmetsp:Transcript_41601/g.62191  ORF Transcript_41601/g.62191 Transcript_41601/m.62191 type:complete len:81 (-) Transcript_41601:133-375(-)